MRVRTSYGFTSCDEWTARAKEIGENMTKVAELRISYMPTCSRHRSYSCCFLLKNCGCHRGLGFASILLVFGFCVFHNGAWDVSLKPPQVLVTAEALLYP